MNFANAGSQVRYPNDPDDPGHPRSVLRFGARGHGPAAAGLPLRGPQMDATMRGPDGSGKCDLFLSSSPSVNYRKHPSEVHARAAYRANNYTGGQDSALTYPPKLQKRRKYPEKRYKTRDQAAPQAGRPRQVGLEFTFSVHSPKAGRVMSNQAVSDRTDLQAGT